MNFFLGFFPDEKSNYKVRKVVAQVGKLFDDFNIPVRWVKPETFHITLYYLGERISFIRAFFLKRKLKKISFKPFVITLGNVKLGISRQHKELVYLDVLEGGDKLRDLLLEVRGVIKGNDSKKFVPHLTIGRVSKDLSDQEYKNIVKDLSNISSQLNISDISFEVYSLSLVKSEDGNYNVLMNFNDSVNTRL